MNHLRPRGLLVLLAVAFFAGLVASTSLAPLAVPEAGEKVGEIEWSLPERAQLNGGAIVQRIISRGQLIGIDASGVEDEKDVEADREAEIAAREAARRDAHQWRFIGSVDRQAQLHALFRAGDGRTRRLVAGEEIEHGARLVELQADSAVIELPQRLRAQNDLPETEGPVRLQLFRDTEFSLYIEEE